MKTISILVVAAAVMLAGFFLFNHYIYTEKQGEVVEQPTDVEVELSGIVREVNLDEMAADGPARITFTTAEGATHSIAVPSMGLPMCLAKDNLASVSDILVGDIVVVAGAQSANGEIVPCASDAHFLMVERLYSSDKLALSFSYRIGPRGLTLSEDASSTMSTDDTYIGGATLVETAEVLALVDREGGEGPPTVNARVYTATSTDEPQAWAEAHPLESNIELMMGEPMFEPLSDVDALRYTTDGLYPTDTVIVKANDKMYVLMGSYLDEGSPIQVAFTALLESVAFSADAVN